MYLAHLIKPVISGNKNKTFKKEWLRETIPFPVVQPVNGLRNLLKLCFILIGSESAHFLAVPLFSSSTIAFCHFSLGISVILKKGTRWGLTCF